ncbi:MAG: hypothetical protein LBG58_02955 [Planctomycetaceae bacterium]|jgi:hypothetical protein|nr:hypothetical protein [Planctomycetaceae bacterium]
MIVVYNLRGNISVERIDRVESLKIRFLTATFYVKTLVSNVPIVPKVALYTHHTLKFGFIDAIFFYLLFKIL